MKRLRVGWSLPWAMPVGMVCSLHPSMYQVALYLHCTGPTCRGAVRCHGLPWSLVLLPLLLLLRAGVETNPGPGKFLWMGCHTYSTDQKSNMTRHIRYSCEGKKREAEEEEGGAGGGGRSKRS